ncbi:5066_t:CDS:2 [Entrophospora sp. SA101]|nr:5066_t:CDS:2 [Entrophospora sp. SA101]
MKDCLNYVICKEIPWIIVTKQTELYTGNQANYTNWSNERLFKLCNMQRDCFGSWGDDITIIGVYSSGKCLFHI